MITRLVLLADSRAPRRVPTGVGTEWRWALGLARLRREFPTVEVEIRDASAAMVPHVRVSEWHGFGFDPYAYDHAFHGQRPSTVMIEGPRTGETATIALEVLTRYQGLVARRNRASRGRVFDAVLARHRQLHDLSKPLVAADYWHALDTWQWTLRLCPHAGLSLQAAALFHDVERLESEADARVEHLAPDYQAFKDAHARRGAAIAAGVLRAAGVTGEDLGQALALVERHEVRDDHPDLAVLNDADALSFLGLNSAGYLDYFGEAQMRRKLAYTLGRMRRASMPLLTSVRYRADVERLLVSALLDASATAAVEPTAEIAPIDAVDTLDPVPAGDDSVLDLDDTDLPVVLPRPDAPPAPEPLAPAEHSRAPEPPPLPAGRRRPIPPAVNTDREGRTPWRERHGGVGAAIDLAELDAALRALEARASAGPPPLELPAAAAGAHDERPGSPHAGLGAAPPGGPTPPRRPPRAANDDGLPFGEASPADGEDRAASAAAPDPTSPGFWQPRPAGAAPAGSPLPAAPVPAPREGEAPSELAGAAGGLATDAQVDLGDDDWPTSVNRADAGMPGTGVRGLMRAR